MTKQSVFPVFDLERFENATSEEKEILASEVDRICRSTGFLAVINHGVPQDVIDSAWSKAQAFFDLPAEEKQRSMGPKGHPYGYIGPELESLAKSMSVDSPPDLKESFNGGPLLKPKGTTDPQALAFCYADTIWPAAPEGFVDSWKTYYAAMEDLGGRIMRVFAVALGLDEDYFESFHSEPISALRALNYPEQHVPPKPGQIRAGAHSDYGTLTILLPQAGSRGLEIIAPDGEWTPVPPIPGAYVINIGDLMSRWTNDRWVSTVHRVINPPREEGGMDRRQSMAFFFQPNWDADIKVLDVCVAGGAKPMYAPVKAGPYLMAKFEATTK